MQWVVERLGPKALFPTDVQQRVGVNALHRLVRNNRDWLANANSLPAINDQYGLGRSSRARSPGPSA